MSILGYRATGRKARRRNPRTLGPAPCRSDGTRYTARGVSSTLTDPMARLWRAVRWRLAYGPRFLRHYRNRRQIGCSPGVAFRSARERMRQPRP
jgi:hypothetical protein